MKKLAYLIFGVALVFAAYAAKQTISIGSAPNDGMGSTLRAGGTIINDNFTELYGGSAWTGGAASKVLTYGTPPTWETPSSQTSSTFTTTYPNACTTTPTQNWAYIKSGEIITIYPTDQESCTGDAVTFNSSGGTALPAVARPLNTVCFPTTATDTGSATAALLTINTSGVVFLVKGSGDCGGGNFTASGTRTFPASSSSNPYFTYRVAP